MTIGLAVGGGLLIAALSMNKKTDTPLIDERQTPITTKDPPKVPATATKNVFTTGISSYLNSVADSAFAAYAAKSTMNVFERYTLATAVASNNYSWLAVDVPDSVKSQLTSAIQYWFAVTRTSFEQSKEEMVGWMIAYLSK